VGVIAGKCRINHLLSANDLVLIASFEQGLLHALDLFSAACEHGGRGMQISTKLIKVLCLSENQNQCPLQVSIYYIAAG